MATCALLGQAAGCAAAVAVQNGLAPREMAKRYTTTVQKILMDHGVFLPHIKHEVSKLTKRAVFNITDEEREILLNGMERPRTDVKENSITQKINDELKLCFDKPVKITSLRLCFDPDFTRASISDNKKMRVFAMKLHTGKDFKPVRVASTLVKDFIVYADGKEIARVENNFRRLVSIELYTIASNIAIKWISTHGAEDIRLFSVDVQEEVTDLN